MKYTCGGHEGMRVLNAHCSEHALIDLCLPLSPPNPFFSSVTEPAVWQSTVEQHEAEGGTRTAGEVSAAGA